MQNKFTHMEVTILAKAFSLTIFLILFLTLFLFTTALCQDALLQPESQSNSSEGIAAFKILTPTDNSVVSEMPAVIFIRVTGVEHEENGKLRVGNFTIDDEVIQSSLILEIKAQNNEQAETEKIEDYGYILKIYNGYDLFRYELSKPAKSFIPEVKYTLVARQKLEQQIFAPAESHFTISPDIFKELVPSMEFESEKHMLSIYGESNNIAQLTIVLDNKIILESSVPTVNHSFTLAPGKHDVWLLATDKSSYHQVKYKEFENPAIEKPTISFITVLKSGPDEKIDVIRDKKRVYFTQYDKLKSVEISSDSESVELFLNGNSISLEPEHKGNLFIFENIPLQRGRNILEAIAKYKYITSDRSEPISVVFDQMAPKIEIYPKETARLVMDSEITITITDNGELNFARFWVGETQLKDEDVRKIPETESSIIAVFSLKNRKDWIKGNKYVFRVNAVDKAGLESENSRTFIFSEGTNEPPQVTIISPLQNSLVSHNKVQIKAEIKDDVFLNKSNIGLTIDGNPEPFDYKDEILNTIAQPLSDGPHVILIWARDADGELKTVSLSFSVDTTSPKVIEVNIPDSKTMVGEEYEWMTSNNKIYVEATVDEENCDLLFNQQAGKINFADKRKFTSELIHLNEGINNISITAKDSAGNQTRHGVKIYSDTQKPILVRTVPEQDTKLKNFGEIPIIVELEDTGVGIAPGSVRIFLEPEETSAPIDEPREELVECLLQITQTYNLTRASVTKREYKIDIEAEDKVSNQLRMTASFFVDTTIDDTDTPLIHPPMLKTGEKILTILNEQEERFINQSIFDISASVNDYGSGLANARMKLEIKGITLEAILKKPTNPGKKAELTLKIPSLDEGIGEIEDGKYTIEISATDSASEGPNQVVKRYTFIKHSKLPPLEAFFVSVSDKKFYFETSTWPKVNYIKSEEEPILSVDKKKLDKERLAGQPFEIMINREKINETQGEYGFALKSLSGVFDKTIMLVVKDKAGNLTSGYLRLSLDYLDPTVEFLQPRFEADSLTADATAIAVHLSDDESGIKDIRLYFDNQLQTVNLDQYDKKSRIFWHKLPFAEEGQHKIQLEVEDNAGRITRKEKDITVVVQQPRIEELRNRIDIEGFPDNEGNITRLKLVVNPVENPAGYYIIHVPDSSIEISPIEGKSESINFDDKDGGLFNWSSSKKQEIFALRRKKEDSYIPFEPGKPIKLEIFEAEIVRADGRFTAKSLSWEKEIFIDNEPPNITFLNPPPEDFFIADNQSPLSLELKDSALPIVAKIEDEHSKVATIELQLQEDEEWQMVNFNPESYNPVNKVFYYELSELDKEKIYKLKLTATDSKGNLSELVSREFRIIVGSEKLSEKLRVEHLFEGKRITEVGDNSYIEIKKPIDQLKVWVEGHKKAGGNYALLLKVNDIERSKENRENRGTILDLLSKKYPGLKFQPLEDNYGMGVEGDKACLLHWNLQGDNDRLKEENKFLLSFSNSVEWEAIIGEEVKILIFKVKANQNGAYELKHDRTFQFEYIESEMQLKLAFLFRAPNFKGLIRNLNDNVEKTSVSVTIARRYGGDESLQKFLYSFLQFNLAINDGRFYLSLAPGTRYFPANVHFGMKILDLREDDLRTDDKETFVGISLGAELFDFEKWYKEIF